MMRTLLVILYSFLFNFITASLQDLEDKLDDSEDD